MDKGEKSIFTDKLTEGKKIIKLSCHKNSSKPVTLIDDFPLQLPR